MLDMDMEKEWGWLLSLWDGDDMDAAHLEVATTEEEFNWQGHPHLIKILL